MQLAAPAANDAPVLPETIVIETRHLVGLYAMAAHWLNDHRTSVEAGILNLDDGLAEAMQVTGKLLGIEQDDAQAPDT